MPLETAQLLSTTLHLSDPARWAELHAGGLAYKATHQNHPCAVWTRECLNNYLWLAALGLELCAEYEYRYGGRPRRGESGPREHASKPVIAALLKAAPALPRCRHITPFALALPEDCQLGDAVLSYRRYYALHKSAFARWTRRPPPEWYVTGLAQYTAGKC